MYQRPVYKILITILATWNKIFFWSIYSRLVAQYLTCCEVYKKGLHRTEQKAFIGYQAGGDMTARWRNLFFQTGLQRGRLCPCLSVVLYRNDNQGTTARWRNMFFSTGLQRGRLCPCASVVPSRNDYHDTIWSISHIRQPNDQYEQALVADSGKKQCCRGIGPALGGAKTKQTKNGDRSETTT